MKKGMSLPINLIVVIAIAVLVLVIVAAFFTGFFGTSGGTLSQEQAFNRACGALQSGYQCDPNNVDDVKSTYKKSSTDTTEYTLKKLCEEKGIIDTTGVACARACGCNV